VSITDRPRVLLSCSIGGARHLQPVIEAGRAAEDADYEALVVVPPALEAAIRREQLPYAVGDGPSRDLTDDVWRRVRTEPPAWTAGLIDRELFAGHGTRAMLPRYREIVAEWQPDLIIREPCEYASAIVAHELGLPMGQVGISHSGLDWQVLETVAATLDDYLPGVADAIRDAPYLTAFPAELDRSPWPQTWRFRREPNESTDGPIGTADTPAGGVDAKPLVHITLGSAAGRRLQDGPGLFAAAIEAVDRLPVAALVTVGGALDPAASDPVPENVRVQRWISQTEVRLDAAAVVCHGDTDTVLGALTAGVPLVVCPLFADQPANAWMVAGAGAGVVLEPPDSGTRSFGAESVQPLRLAIERVIGDPAYRAAAGRVAREVARQPTLRERIASLVPAR
jgi:UDP:flavonoid glycosyltransferase YjiC (YdhE family)